MACETPLRLAQFFFHLSALPPECVEVFHSPVVATAFDFLGYAKVFLLTCLLEAPFYIWALWKTTLTWPARFGAVLLLNAITHPLIYFAFPYVFGHTTFEYASFLLVAETFAPTVEAVVLRRVYLLSALRAIVAAVGANLFSWWVGTL